MIEPINTLVQDDFITYIFDKDSLRAKDIRRLKELVSLTHKITAIITDYTQYSAIVTFHIEERNKEDKYGI